MEQGYSKVLLKGAWVSFPLAYLYIWATWGPHSHGNYFWLSLLFIIAVEFLSYKEGYKLSMMDGQGRKFSPEWLVLISAVVLQSASIFLWEYHREMETYQFAGLHLTIALYIYVRTGSLLQGRIGILFWKDLLRMIFVQPLDHFMLRAKVFSFGRWMKKQESLRKAGEDENSQGSGQTKAEKRRDWLLLGLTVLVTLLLVRFVWSQLALASDGFLSFSKVLSGFWNLKFRVIFLDGFFEEIVRFFCYLLPSIPVGMWLFGLAGGGIVNNRMCLDFRPGEKDSYKYGEFVRGLERSRIFPLLAAYLLMCSLLLIYTMFFVTSLGEMWSLFSGATARTMRDMVSAQEASSYAVEGFWQLVRVCLVNFAVLGGSFLFAKESFLEVKGLKLTTAGLFTASTMLALLAGWKLFGLYIFLYGLTPRRIMSAWFLLLLLVWSIMVLVRLYKPIQAIRWAVLYGFFSFSILVIVPWEKWMV